MDDPLDVVAAGRSTSPLRIIMGGYEGSSTLWAEFSLGQYSPYISISLSTPYMYTHMTYIQVF